VTDAADAQTAGPSPIDRCLERWKSHLRGELEGGLDELLHDDVTFWSPIVFSPQRGKEITKLYLTAAGTTLVGTDDADGADGDGARGSAGDSSGSGGGFRYVRTISDGHDAVLEFETSMDGLYVNGIDLITCDDDARIVDFKVMIRPLKAVNAVHDQMRAMLERLRSG
jgi:hypothetical protein